jgi:hypothetical protein
MSKAEVGSSRLLGIVGQPMHLLIPLIRQKGYIVIQKYYVKFLENSIKL